MRLPTIVLLALAVLAGPAEAVVQGEPAECRAAEARMNGLLREAGNRDSAIAALERFIPTIPEQCADFRARAESILRSLREPQAAPRQMETQSMRMARRPAAAEQFTLPDFPWPPPTPSARLVVPRERLIRTLPEHPNLFQVGAHLTDALQRARYSEYSFFAVPNGFALTARLERIRNDGTPAPEEFRFLEPGAAEPFSLSSYITRLFFAPEGFYRQIVFVVTDKPFVASGEAPTSQTAEEWLRQGANVLPEIFRTMPFGPGYRVTALVYEFRKGAQDRDVSTLTPGRIAGRTHLEKSGIYPALLQQ